FDRPLPPLARMWQGPRVLCIVVIGDANPDSDQVAFALSFRNDLLRGVGRHSSNCRKKLPLVGYGWKSESMNTLLPNLRGANCKGSAIRFPSPPLGIVSWLGKKRS